MQILNEETNEYELATFIDLYLGYKNTLSPCIYYDKNENYIESIISAYSECYEVHYGGKGYALDRIEVEK